MTKKETANTNFSKYIKWFWVTILGGTAMVILLFLFASWGFYGALPTFEELEKLANEECANEACSIPNLEDLD